MTGRLIAMAMFGALLPAAAPATAEDETAPPAEPRITFSHKQTDPEGDRMRGPNVIKCSLMARK
jgi:hypothetical protein